VTADTPTPADLPPLEPSSRTPASPYLCWFPMSGQTLVRAWKLV